MKAASSAQSAPIGRRERKKVVTRDELLRAGRRFFADKGLYEPRVEDLTRYAGIAKGTFYRYYETKEDLVLAVVKDGFAQLQASLTSGIEKATTVEELSRAIVEGHIAFFAANPDLMRILHQARGVLKFDRNERLPLRRALTGHLAYLGWVLANGSPRQLGARSALELAGLLFGGVSGALSVHVAREPRKPLPSRMPRLTDAFVALAQGYVSRAR